MDNEILTKQKRNGYRLDDFSHNEIGDDHLYTGIETPMKPDAFYSQTKKKKKGLLICLKKS